jgi:integrase/recombinase XerD
MRVSEVAQVTIADICFPCGKLRIEVSLRAAITKGLRHRCIYLSSPKLVDAIERYLDYRVLNELGATLDQGRYRGLNPALALILSRKGYPYALNRKLRCAESGEVVEYWAADSLQA